MPIFGVTPSKAQIALDPARYAVGRPEQVAPSQEWLDLEPRTRKDYTRFVDRILVLWRHEFVADLEVEMVTEMRDARRGTPRMANYILNVLNAMLSLALQKKRTFGISANVAANVTRFGVKAGVKPRRVYWTYEDEKRFLDDADQTDPVMALGQRLLAFTGQRPGDTRTMMLTDYDARGRCCKRRLPARRARRTDG